MAIDPDMSTMRRQTLPRPGPARVLGVGAFLKNTACLVDGATATWSPLHGDLSTPEACRALEASVSALISSVGPPIDAVAHDLHPDFHSTRLAQQWAARLGVPAVAVQHHHAHLAVVQAEHGVVDADGPWIGLALDGVGLGTDGAAWGGELLAVLDGVAQRVAHLPPLALPGGDVAAREPWRLVAAVLHGTGQAGRIDAVLAEAVGPTLARGVRSMLDRRLNCPVSTAAGRWFDAAAGALRLSVRQTREAEAAVALERAATQWLDDGGVLAPAAAAPRLADMPALVAALVDEPDTGRGAARFHATLAQALVAEAAGAAVRYRARSVALGGGCFFNRLLDSAIDEGLRAHGLAVRRPAAAGCGDAGLALGQAWAAAQAVASSRAAARGARSATDSHAPHDPACGDSRPTRAVHAATLSPET